MPHPLLRLLAVTTALASALTLVDLRGRTLGILLWAPKLLAGALAPLLAIIGGALTACGLRRRDPLVMGAGLVSAALASRYTAGVTAPVALFAALMLLGDLVKILFIRRHSFTVRGYSPALLYGLTSTYILGYAALLLLEWLK